MSKDNDERVQQSDVNQEITEELTDAVLESAAGGIVYPINGGTYPTTFKKPNGNSVSTQAGTLT